MNWFQSPLIEAFGRTLLHSLWQLSAIAALTTGVLFLMRRKSANARYILCLIALLLMTAMPIATFLYVKPAVAPIPFTSHIVVGSPEHTAPDAIISAPLSITMGSSSWSGRMLDAVHPLLPIAVAAYFLGALFLSLRLAIGYLHVRRLPQKSSPVTAEIHDLFISLCHRLAISRPVKVLSSAIVEVPTVLGGLRPIILIPASAITGMPIEHLHDLLAHELAHVRRHDYLVNILQCIIETLLFYHPAVWWLSARIRQEREHCCDDIAIALSGNRLHYAQALAAMESLRAAPMTIPSSLVIGARTGALLPRIRRVLRMPSSSNDRRHPFALTSTLFTLSILISLAYILGCGQQKKAISGSAATAPTEVSGQATGHGPVPFGDKPVVDLDTRIMAVDESTLQSAKQLLFPLKFSFDADGKTPIISSEKNTQTIVIAPTQADFSIFLTAIERSKTSTTIATPRITLFSGQKGFIQIGEKIPYVSGYNLSDPQTAGSTIVPVISYVEPGISLPITATIAQDHKNVLVDFNLTVTHLLRMDSLPARSAPFTNKNARIQSPVLDQRQVTGEILIPNHRTVVIFGPEIFPPFLGSQTSDNTPRHLVISIRSDILLPKTATRPKN